MICGRGRTRGGNSHCCVTKNSFRSAAGTKLRRQMIPSSKNCWPSSSKPQPEKIYGTARFDPATAHALEPDGARGGLVCFSGDGAAALRLRLLHLPHGGAQGLVCH